MFGVLFLTILSVFLMMLLGAVLYRSGALSDLGIRDASKLLVFGIYPCLIFSSITTNFSLREMFAAWALPAGSMLIMVVGYILAKIATLFVSFRSEDKKNAFLFQNTINNYSFLPIVIVAEIFGSQEVAALIFSTLGAEIVVWTLGVFILNGHKLDKKSLLHLFSPPLLALFGAFLWLGVFEFGGLNRGLYLEKSAILYYFHNPITVIGSATIPVAMIITGTRLSKIKFVHMASLDIWFKTIMRLVIVPLFAIMIIGVLPLREQWKSVLIVVAVMPTSMLSSLMCEIYNGDRELINGTILITHILSFLTIPLLLSTFLQIP